MATLSLLTINNEKTYQFIGEQTIYMVKYDILQSSTLTDTFALRKKRK